MVPSPYVPSLAVPMLHTDTDPETPTKPPPTEIASVRMSFVARAYTPTSLLAVAVVFDPIDAVVSALTTPMSTAPAMPTSPPAAPPPRVKVFTLFAASTLID